MIIRCTRSGLGVAGRRADMGRRALLVGAPGMGIMHRSLKHMICIRMTTRHPGAALLFLALLALTACASARNPAADHIAGADHAVVYRLGAIAAPAPDGFTLPSQADSAVIIDRRVLTPEASRDLLAALATMVRTEPTDPARCFDPGWGVEVVAADGSMVARIALCYHCRDYAIDTEGSARLVGMPAGPAPEHLRVLLANLMLEKAAGAGH